MLNQFWTTCVMAALTASPAIAGEVSLSSKGHATNPTWSRGTGRLAVEVNDMANRIDMFVVDVSSGSVGRANPVSLPGGNATFGSSSVVASSPVWHPEVLVLTGAVSGREFRLFFTPPNGGQASELLQRTQVDGALSFPTVSPDGQEFAFVSARSGSGDILLYNRATGGVSDLVRSSSPETFPSYGRDGKRLYFTRRKADREEIVSVPSGGGSETIVATGKGYRSRPVEAAGGRLVYFVKSSGSEEWRIASNAISGGSEKIIARGVALPERAAPALSPDGQWVFYGVTDPVAAQAIYAINITNGKTMVVPTRLVGAREPAVGIAGGKMMLAFTALPGEGADWRQLHVIDVSDKF